MRNRTGPRVAALDGLACCCPPIAAPSTPAAPARARPPSAIAGAPGRRRPRIQDGDGRPDAWAVRGADGSVSRLAYDLDRDGAPDVVLVFEGGALVRKELVHRMDGVPPTWSVFEKGELGPKERDTDGDGRPDLWERYANGQLVEIEIDADRDGAPDRIERGPPRRRRPRLGPVRELQRPAPQARSPRGLEAVKRSVRSPRPTPMSGVEHLLVASHAARAAARSAHMTAPRLRRAPPAVAVALTTLALAACAGRAAFTRAPPRRSAAATPTSTAATPSARRSPSRTRSSSTWTFPRR